MLNPLALVSKPQFQPVDPLADGLADDIAREQAEGEVITLNDPIDESALAAYWQTVSDEVRQDPSWIWVEE